MLDKIVFIRFLPLSEYIYKSYFIGELVQGGFDVEYWDTYDICFNKKNIELQTFENDIERKIYNVKEFVTYISKKSRSKQKIIYIPLMYYTWDTRKIFKILGDYQCLVGLFYNDLMPSMPQSNKLSFSVLKKINYGSVRNYIKLCLARAYKVYNKLTLANVIFGIEQSKELFHHKEFIPIHSSDYDLSLSKCNRLIEEDYIVFLDQYLPMHQDFKLMGIKTVTEEKYFSEINKLFDLIEKEYNMKVVIAAHPKAMLYKEQNYFNNRDVYFGETNRLTKHSSLVLLHDSTSISFAIIYNKPILFITTSEMEQYMDSDMLFINKMSNTLASLIISTSNPIELPDLALNQDSSEQYKVYARKYLFSESVKDVLTIDVLLNYFKNEFH